jgi:flagellar protein FlaG
MGIKISGSGDPAYLRDAMLREPGQARRDAPQAKQTAEQRDLRRSDIQASLQALERTSLAFNRRLRFYVNEEIDRVVVKVVDAETDKVIKEIPSEEVQDLAARIEKAIGLLVDEVI